MRKSAMIIGLIAVLVLSLSATQLYAGGYYKGRGGCYKKGMADKIYRKAGMMYAYQEEIGLSDEQVEKIKVLKMNTKKDLIRRKAEIDVISVDIKSELWEDTIDVDAINTLIDKKYELKKEKAKSLVRAYAELKGILTEEQMDKLKSVCLKQKQQKYSMR